MSERPGHRFGACRLKASREVASSVLPGRKPETRPKAGRRWQGWIRLCSSRYSDTQSKMPARGGHFSLNGVPGNQDFFSAAAAFLSAAAFLAAAFFSAAAAFLSAAAFLAAAFFSAAMAFLSAAVGLASDFIGAAAAAGAAPEAAAIGAPACEAAKAVETANTE